MIYPKIDELRIVEEFYNMTKPCSFNKSLLTKVEWHKALS